MFGTIRKHQTWLWVFLIALMSVSLVFFFSNDPGVLGSKDDPQKRDLGSFNGRPIGEREFIAAIREIWTASVIRTQKLPPTDEATDAAVKEQAAARVFAKWLVRKHRIEPSEKAVAQLVQQQLGNFPYDRLEKEFLQPNNLTTADYERFMRHEAGIYQLMAAAGASAKLINPREADLIYRKEHQETEVQVAVFWASNFLDKVVITNGAIGAFYTNRQFMYRVPERTVLGYVEFTSTNYFAEADKQMAANTNIENIVNNIFFQRDTNDVLWKDDQGVPLVEADAKKKIREMIREREFALQSARRDAAGFGTALLEPKATPGLDPNPHLYGNLEKLAAARGLTVKTTQPFDAISGLEEFEAPTNALPRREDEFNLREIVRKAALELRDTNAIRFTPITGPHAVYVVGRKSSVPAETPPLEKISQKVTNDYRNFLAQDLARKTGMAFGTNVTNGIAMKKSFAEICKAEGVTVLDVPPFSDITQSLTNFDARINLRLLQNLARDLEPGKATSFVPFSQEGGLVLHVKGRPKLDDAKVQAAMPEFVNQLRNYRQSESFSMWFNEQAKLARFVRPKRDMPTAPGMPGSGPPGQPQPVRN